MKKWLSLIIVANTLASLFPVSDFSEAAASMLPAFPGAEGDEHAVYA